MKPSTFKVSWSRPAGNATGSFRRFAANSEDGAFERITRSIWSFSWSKDLVKMLLMITLWLCQNSYWTWPSRNSGIFPFIAWWIFPVRYVNVYQRVLMFFSTDFMVLHKISVDFLQDFCSLASRPVPFSFERNHQRVFCLPKSSCERPKDNRKPWGTFQGDHWQSFHEIWSISFAFSKEKRGMQLGYRYMIYIYIYIIALLQHMALSLWQGAQGTPRNPRVNHNFPGLIIIFPFQTNSHQIPIHILAGLSSEKSLENFEHPMI